MTKICRDIYGKSKALVTEHRTYSRLSTTKDRLISVAVLNFDVDI